MAVRLACVALPREERTRKIVLEIGNITEGCSHAVISGAMGGKNSFQVPDELMYLMR